jgi:AraC-like DNA-binding protein
MRIDMQSFLNECPRVTVFGKDCGYRTVKSGEQSRIKLTANLLLYSESAQIEINAANEELTLIPGDVVLLPIKTDVSFIVSQDGGVIVISYQTLDDNMLLTPVSLTTSTPKRTKQAFLQFADACEDKKALRDFAMRSTFYATLYHLARNSKSGNRLFLKDNTLKAARTYLDRHFSDSDLRITTAAQKAGISPTYLRRLFLSVEGCTPLQYVTDLRIRRAQELIKRGGLSMEEITRACGLSDTDYLKKLLKNAENTEKSN